jgi:hypothetical protein
LTKQLGTGILIVVLSAAGWTLPASISAQTASGRTVQDASRVAPGTEAPVNVNGTDPASSSSTEAKVSADGEQRVFPGERPPALLLGMTLETAVAEFGAPGQVFPVRGQEAWEDDVVFYYADHSYLFWFRDRVWQVRVDRRFSGSILGLKMGESREKVQSVLGIPFHADNDSEIFILPDRGFPVRARLFFTADELSDIYVYRGDF